MAGQKNNIIARLQRWMDSVPGQSFLNYAYSWGAAIVILGALFKLTHIKGADLMLFVGMSTEVFVFIISGFDRPFDAKKDEPDELEDIHDFEKVKREDTDMEPAAVPVRQEQAGEVTAYASSVEVATVSAVSAAAAVDTQKLLEIVQEANKDLMEQAKSACNPEIGVAAENYVQELKELTEILRQVGEQARHLTQDSEEMDKLNRTLTSINTIYEMQLKSVSLQVGAIDQINDQTRRMAQLIEELNSVYTRMIQALTVNMPKNGGGAQQPL
ncbi:gliding motility protein GldL [Bacteroides eggerthii]|uniref:Gliding motility protein GldL n=1 Tax=Bacteroides eggerthii TaxID=28111 RepID=A0ABT7U5X8_9BACE|nr:gliding motility protein GldL [Bacteroides eggerthii]